MEEHVTPLALVAYVIGAILLSYLFTLINQPKPKKR